MHLLTLKFLHFAWGSTSSPKKDIDSPPVKPVSCIHPLHCPFRLMLRRTIMILQVKRIQETCIKDNILSRLLKTQMLIMHMKHFTLPICWIYRLSKLQWNALEKILEPLFEFNIPPWRRKDFHKVIWSNEEPSSFLRKTVHGLDSSSMNRAQHTLLEMNVKLRWHCRNSVVRRPIAVPCLTPAWS